MFRSTYAGMMTAALLCVCFVGQPCAFSQEAAPAGSPVSIYDMIPADSPMFLATPELAGLRSDLGSFISALGMPQLPSDPIGILMAQLGLFQGVDNSKGAAMIFLSEASTGVSLARMMELEENASPVSEDEAPFAIVFGGSSVEEVFSMYSPVQEGDGYVFMINRSKIFAKAARGYIIVAPNSRAIDIVASATETIASTADAGRLTNLKQGNLVASVDAQALLPVVKELRKRIEMEMDMNLAMTDGKQQAFAFDMVKGVFTMWIDAFAQVRGADLGVAFSSAGIKIDKFVRPMPETGMAALLKAIKPTGAFRLDLLPQRNYAAVFASDFGTILATAEGKRLLKSLTELSLSFLNSDMDKATVDDYVNGLVAAYGSRYDAVGMVAVGSDEQPMLILNQMLVDNPDRYLAYMTETSDVQKRMFSKLFSMFPGEGGDYTFGPSGQTLAGEDIYELKITYPEGYPSPDMGVNDQFSVKFGENRIGTVTGSAENLKLLAPDAAGARLVDDASVKAAIEALPKKSFFVCMAGAPGGYEMVIKFVKLNVADMDESLEQMLRMAAPTCTDLIACGAAAEDGVLHGRLVLPSGIFADVIKGVMIAQQYAMQQMQQMQQGQGGSNGPGSSDF